MASNTGNGFSARPNGCSPSPRGGKSGGNSDGVDKEPSAQEQRRFNDNAQRPPPSPPKKNGPANKMKYTLRPETRATRALTRTRKREQTEMKEQRKRKERDLAEQRDRDDADAFEEARRESLRSWAAKQKAARETATATSASASSAAKRPAAASPSSSRVFRSVGNRTPEVRSGKVGDSPEVEDVVDEDEQKGTSANAPDAGSVAQNGLSVHEESDDGMHAADIVMANTQERQDEQHRTPSRPYKIIEMYDTWALNKANPQGCGELSDKNENCELAACCKVTNSTEERDVCLDHLDKDYGGLPKTVKDLPVRHITKRNRELVAQKCSTRELHEIDFPSDLPSQAPHAQHRGRLAPTSKSTKCGVYGLGGIKSLSPENIAALDNLDDEVARWQDKASGADALKSFLLRNNHVVIQPLCGGGLKLILSVLGATGDKAIQFALVESNGDHDPRAHRRVFIISGPPQLDLGQRLPGYKKALNADGKKLVADLAEPLNHALSERLHAIATAPEAADAKLNRYQGIHPDQSVHDPWVFTFRRLFVAGPGFGLLLVASFVWVGDDGKKHQRKISECTLPIDGCVSYGMSHFGSGRKVIGSAVDPKDGIQKGIVVMHSPVPIGDMPKKWRLIVVHDSKFSDQREHDDCIAKFASGSLSLPFDPSSCPLSEELATTQAEDLQSVMADRLGSMAVHTGDQVICSHPGCPTPASCFNLGNGGEELLEKQRMDPFANVDDRDEAWLQCLSCRTHADRDNAILDVCTGCFLRPKLCGKPRCTTCVEYRCIGYKEVGSDEGAETMFACEERTEDDKANGVGVLLNSANKVSGDKTRCNKCHAAYTRSRTGGEERVTKPQLQMKHYRDAFTAFAMPKYRSKSGKSVNWKKIVDEDDGYGLLKGLDSETVSNGVVNMGRRQTVHKTGKCKDCKTKSGKCKFAGMKVDSLERFSAFEEHGGSVRKLGRQQI